MPAPSNFGTSPNETHHYGNRQWVLRLQGNGPATFFAIPSKDELLGKTGKVIKRVDHYELELALAPFLSDPCAAYIERPFTGGPMMINTSLLAARAYEAVIIVMERLGIGWHRVDSREWQSAMLPGVKGSAELKKASRLRGIQLYPALATAIKHHGDADGLLMAHHFSSNNL
jgi:hypothetical protein